LNNAASSNVSGGRSEATAAESRARHILVYWVRGFDESILALLDRLREGRYSIGAVEADHPDHIPDWDFTPEHLLKRLC
jgi:hypothetical protein